MLTLKNSKTDTTIREHLVELLTGGFAPNVILLREFDYAEAGVILDGLYFSAWILLGHIQSRQKNAPELQEES